MTFILVPNQGQDLQINAWNWRPTLELLFAEGVITEDDHERMGAQGLGGKVDEAKALTIAKVIERKLLGMSSAERTLANLTVTREPKKQAVFTPGTKVDDVDSNELYSTTYEWLETFVNFCRSSRGFKVM
jgi:hypothetical protein